MRVIQYCLGRLGAARDFLCQRGIAKEEKVYDQGK